VPSSISAAKTLKAGELYYIEIFQINGSGGGHVTLAVEAPSATLQYNSIPQIQKLAATHGGKIEKISYKFYNTADNALNKGRYKLNFRKKEAGKTTFLIDVNCVDVTADFPLDKLTQWVQWCGWPAYVERTPLDKTGA
jgi:hypothetical protein